MDRGRGSSTIPDLPLVHVEIDETGRITVDGVVEPHARLVDRRSLADLAVLAVARDHAGPLGRGVRVVARTPTEHSSMVVHPDGVVTDLLPHGETVPVPPATSGRHGASPDGVVPAMRAQHWLDAREEERVRVAERAASRADVRTGRRRLLAGLVGAVAAVTAFVAVVDVGWPGGEGRTPTSSPAVGQLRDTAADVVPADEADPAPSTPPTVVGATRFAALAVTDAGAEAAPGRLQVAVETSRRTPVTLVLAPLPGDATADPARRLQFQVRAATTRLVEVADLTPGRYRWLVRAPGERRLTGLVDVPAVPAPPVTVVPVVEVPAPVAPSAPPAPVAPPPADTADTPAQDSGPAAPAEARPATAPVPATGHPGTRSRPRGRARRRSGDALRS